MDDFRKETRERGETTMPFTKKKIKERYIVEGSVLFSVMFLCSSIICLYHYVVVINYNTYYKE